MPDLDPETLSLVAGARGDDDASNDDENFSEASSQRPLEELVITLGNLNTFITI